MNFLSKKYIGKKFFLFTFSVFGVFLSPFSSVEAAFPVISNVSVSNVTAQGATVSWTTNIPSSSLVDFGISTTYGTTMGNSDELVTEHAVVLTGLFPLTQHYFRVRSVNGGNQTISDNGGVGFTITTTAAPVISQVRLVSVSDTQAVITFRTDIPAYPYIGYGLTDSYGSLIGDEENFGVNHSITLYGLTPGKQYYYKPRVGDVYKNYTYFPGNNFFTTSGPYLQSITTTTSNGTYGPGAQIPIVATYQENIVSGSANITVTLNTGVQIDLNQVSGNTVSGLYVVGVTGSSQNISSLAVSSIDYQNVCDGDGFCYRGTTLPSINVNDNSTVAVDTTAPVFSDIRPVNTWPNAFNNITTSSDIGYTLSENLQSGTIKFLRTSGTVDSGSPHTCTLTGVYLNFGARNNFNMNNCQEGVPALVDGAVYTIRFEGTDLVGNNATRVDMPNMRFDITSPILNSFTSSTPNGTYGAGSVITIIANFNEGASGSMKVILDTGVEVTLSYSSVEGVIRGFYTVGDIDSGQVSEDLTVTQVSYANISDWAGNTTVNTVLTGIEGNNLGDNSDIVIDTAIADAPSLVQFMTDPVNNANKSNVTLRVEGDLGTTIYYSLDDNNGTTAPVTGNILMEGDGSTDITGINLSGLRDGTITAQVQLRKANGEFSSFAQASVIKDTDLPGWYMQYYADSAFTISLGDNPRLSPGVYYIRINFYEGESLNEVTTPKMFINAQGTLNDVNLVPLEKVSSTIYQFTRTIVYDSSASGSVLEDLYIDSLTDFYGNTATNVNPYYESLKSAYTDTIKPTVTGNVTPNYAKAGMVNVALTLSEAMKQTVAPTVRLRKSNGTFLNVNGSYTSTTAWAGSVEIFSGESNGPADLQVSLAQDRAGNVINANENVFNFFIDTQSPTIAINMGTDVDQGPVKTDIINLTALDGSGSGIVTRSYGFSGDYICNEGDSYSMSFQDSVSFEITGNETRYLCARAIDRAGNTAYQLVGKLNVDNTAPTVHSVTSDTTNGSYKAGDSVQIRVNFSENVTTVGNLEILLETGVVDRGCTMSIYQSNYGVCDYVVQEGDTSSDLNQISLTGVVEDLASNLLTNYTPQTSLAANKNIIIDTIAPVIEILSPLVGGSVSGSTTIFFTNNEPTLSQCSFDGLVWSNCASGATSLQLIEGWSSLAEGSIVLYVKDTDLAGNVGIDTVTDLLKDTNYPMVEDVTADRLSGFYKAGTQIPLIVTFSREVTSTGNVIVTLETGVVDRSCTFSLTSATEGRCTYTVQEGDVSDDLNVISISGTIIDSIGNSLASPTPIVNLADNKDIVIDTTKPIITSVNSTHSNGTFIVGEVIDITVTFSEPVTSNNVTVNLDSGGNCSFTLLTATNIGTCLYTVGENQNSLDLTTSSISGVILDRAQNEMANFSPQINLGANKNIKIDTTPNGPPRVTSVTSEKNDGAYTIGSPIPVTVNFSEKVIASGPITVTFETGTIDRSCTIEAQSINNTTFGTCTYTVREGDTSPDLSIKSISGNIYDVVNNQMMSPALPEINLNDLKNIVIDTTPPNIPVISLTNPLTDVNKSNVTISGTGEANAHIQYFIDDTNPLTQLKTGTGVVSSEGNISLAGINLTGLDGGAITVSMTLTDSAGNVSSAGFATATSQILLPVITSITSSKEDGFYPLGETIDIRVNFSENVTSNGDVTVVLETGEVDRSCTFVLNNANVGVCDYIIQSGDTTNDLNVKFVSGEIYDQADNPMVNFGIGSNLANNKNIAIDTVPPPAPNISLTNPITDANKSNVTLSGTGEANALIAYRIDDENPDTNPIEGSGTVASNGNISLAGINLTGLDGGAITVSVTLADSAGNVSEPRVVTNTSQIILPTIVSITSEKADGHYREGETIDIRVNFSENVTSNGEVTVVLETGDIDGICAFSVSNSQSGVCEYVVETGQNSSHLNVASISGSLNDQAGNPLLYFTPQVNLVDSKNIVIDTINVRLDAFLSPSENRTYGPNESITITAKYSEVLREGAEISLILDTGAVITLNTISSEDPTLLIGIYEVGNPGSGEGSIDLKVDSITSQNVCDLAGNCLVGTEENFPGINISTQSNIVVDAVPPVFSEVFPENSTNIENLTDDSDISYVLSEDLEWGTITLARTAWAEDPQSPHVCVLTGDALQAGRHDAFNTELCESGSITLTTGTVYSVAFNGEDSYGNPAREVLKTGISYGLDLTPPVISSVIVEEITSVSAVIRWVTDEDANAFVDFGLENDYSNLRGDSSLGGTEHRVLLNGLSPGITYTFRVRSFDGTLNESIDDNSGEGHVFTTLNLPSVTNTEVSDITFQGATISWEVDTEVYSYLAYGESESFGKAIGDESSLKYQQSVSLDSLKSDQEYYYRIKMRDIYGNISFSPIYTFTTLPDPTDKEFPLISEVSVTEITSKNAKFSWKTDESADSYIEYGLDETYGEIYGSGSLVKDHSILLPPLLIPLTTYYFRVISSDGSGNKSISENMTFVTTEIDPSGVGDDGAGEDGGSGDEQYGDPGEPISFSNIKVSSKTSSSIIVSWETNKPTNGLIRFGLDEKYGSTVAEDLSVDAKENFITKHEIIISNLLYNSTYNYRIVSYDAFGNIGLSSPGKFQTSNIFSVSGVNVSNITLNSAVITWETGDPVTTMLEYGKTISYGQKAEDLEISNYHKVELTNLDAGETYHFRVRGERKDDSSIASDDYVFATYPEPLVEGYSVEKVSDSSANINWRTNVPTESLVSYINAQDPLDTGIQGTTEIKNDHAVEVIGLKQGSDYEFRIKGIDINKNVFESDPFNVKTDIDLTPPTISFINSKTSMVSEAEEIIQAIISWKTNEPATSQLFFDVGMGDADLTQQTKVDENLTTNHVVVLTDLRPGSVYRFNAVSQDANNNIQKSETFSFLTPRKEKSVFQLIIANFEETFGWMKGMGK